MRSHRGSWARWCVAWQSQQNPRGFFGLSCACNVCNSVWHEKLAIDNCMQQCNVQGCFVWGSMPGGCCAQPGSALPVVGQHVSCVMCPVTDHL